MFGESFPQEYEYQMDCLAVLNEIPTPSINNKQKMYTF